MGSIDDRLRQLGITLPAAATPVANYVAFVQTGNLVFVAGQIPLLGGKPQQLGQLGAGVSIEDGAKAARICGLNILAQLRAACGGELDRIVRVVKLVGFVNCASHFADIPKVVNGASDLMVEVFGERGKHSRSSVGVASLPMDVSVEVEAVVEIA